VSAPATPSTVTELLLAQADRAQPGLLFEKRRWSWQEHVSECARYAAALRAWRKPGPPFHVGVLADNVPEFSFLLGGCAFAGAVLVALNPVRRGTALAQDVARTDCQYVLAEPRYAALLPAMDVPVLPFDELELPGQAPLDVTPAAADDLLMLIFTSGTSGEPKAVRCTHGKIAVPGRMLAGRFGLTAADTVYVSMPLFHSNAIMAGWAVGLAAGAAIALRRRFSASGFLPDVRSFGATYANYVGKPLSYVLATPARADDADNPLRIAYGNEGAPGDLARFAERFGCRVIDGFGSTEGGVAVSRTPDTPPGALGKLADGVAVLDPETGRRCPPARFSPGGELLNPAAAVGEFVNTQGAGLFAGYYNDAEADASRMRDGMYWSGDLGYADSRGFCWFAGRAGAWLRVDGENLGTAPVERALLRHPAIAEAAVYGVPDVPGEASGGHGGVVFPQGGPGGWVPPARGARGVGDQSLACSVLRGGASLTPAELGAFLNGQGDIGRKQHPRFVRIAGQLPRTVTFKVLTRVLAADRWNTSDPVWWRPDGRSPAYVLLDREQAAALDAEISRPQSA
jgi:fatty-acyl-CoA synthase